MGSPRSVCLTGTDTRYRVKTMPSQPHAIQTSLKQTHSTPLLPPTIHPQPITSNFPVLGGVTRGRQRGRKGSCQPKADTHGSVYSLPVFWLCHGNKRWQRVSESEIGGGGAPGDSRTLWWSAGWVELSAIEMIHLCIMYTSPTNTCLFPLSFNPPSTQPSFSFPVPSAPQALQPGFPKIYFFETGGARTGMSAVPTGNLVHLKPGRPGQANVLARTDLATGGCTHTHSSGRIT